MRGSTRRGGGRGIRAALMAGAAAGLLVSASAGAFPFYVEEWSIESPPGNTVFSDDFEDGIFDPSYIVACGSVGAGDESGGSLTLANPSTGGACGGLSAQIVAAGTTGILGDSIVAGTYQFDVPAVGEAYGIQVTNTTGDDMVLLLVTTIDQPFPGTFVVALDETFGGTSNPTILGLGAPGTGSMIELQLTLTSTTGGFLQPSATFAVDGGAPTNVFIQSGAGLLDLPAAGFFGAALIGVGTVPEPSAALLLGAGLVALGAVRRRARHVSNRSPGA